VQHLVQFALIDEEKAPATKQVSSIGKRPHKCGATQCTRRNFKTTDSQEAHQAICLHYREMMKNQSKLTTFLDPKVQRSDKPTDLEPTALSVATSFAI